jgi:hypothetical protein
MFISVCVRFAAPDEPPQSTTANKAKRPGPTGSAQMMMMMKKKKKAAFPSGDSPSPTLFYSSFYLFCLSFSWLACCFWA